MILININFTLVYQFFKMILRSPSIKQLSNLLLQQINFNTDKEIPYSDFKIKCYKLFPGRFNCDTISSILHQLKQKGYNIYWRYNWDYKKNGNNEYRLAIKAEFKN